jgi:hypothetical protein
LHGTTEVDEDRDERDQAQRVCNIIRLMRIIWMAVILKWDPARRAHQQLDHDLGRRQLHAFSAGK